jgi:phosphoribosylanthranilate isomerase
MLKIKICGMTDRKNIEEIVESSPDYLGFIFYQGSKRYVGDFPDKSLFRNIPSPVMKAGVFVNEEPEIVNKITEDYELDLVQLHGHESVDYCNLLHNRGIKIIKAFEVNDAFDFSALEKYSEVCTYFLFDTKTGSGGGSGTKFNWGKLEEYQIDKPFFLSGGICHGDAQAIRQIKTRYLYGVDINSCFEVTPGIKETELVRKFIGEIKQ